MKDITTRTAPQDFRDPTWPKGLYRRGAFYRYKRTVRGRNYCEVFGEVSSDEAIRRATRHNFDISDGKHLATRTEKQQATFRHLADLWLAAKKGTVTAGSYARYWSVAENFCYFLVQERGLRDCPVSAVTYDIASEYITRRRNSPLMPNGSRKFTRAFKAGAAKATLHFEKQTLTRLFAEAQRRKLIEENPFKDVKADNLTRKELVARRRPLTVPQQRALEQASTLVRSPRPNDARFADIMCFLPRTGERSDEMVHLEWSDVDWDANVIHVVEKVVTEDRTVAIPSDAVRRLKKLVANRTPAENVFRSEEELARSRIHLDIREKAALLSLKVGELDLAKGLIVTRRTFKWSPKGSAGDIPMCKTVRELLRRLQKTSTSNFVFAHHDGGKCRLKLLDMLKKAQKLAGVAGRLRIHDLRHTFAVRLREQGKPLETIMGLMRHASIEETLLYAPYRLEEGEKAVQCFDTLDEAKESVESRPLCAPAENVA